MKEADQYVQLWGARTMTWKHFGGCSQTKHTFVCSGPTSNLSRRCLKFEQEKKGKERAEARPAGARAEEYLEGEGCSAVVELKTTYIRSLMKGTYHRCMHMSHASVPKDALLTISGAGTCVGLLSITTFTGHQ